MGGGSVIDGPADPAFGLHQQRGARNRFGRYDVDIVPPAMAAFRRNYPQIVHWEERIWARSQGRFGLSRTTNFPFVEVEAVPPKEFGFVAYESDDRRHMVIEPLTPLYNPETGNYDRIDLPPHILRTGKFEKPGYKPVIIEHTHPISYSNALPWQSRYEKGPSDKDFKTLSVNPTAIGVIQAQSAAGRQFFFFGLHIYG